MSKARRTGLIGGIVVFVLMLLLPEPSGLSEAGWRTASVAALMAVWWMTEAIPIAATALLPLVLFPFLTARLSGDPRYSRHSFLVFILNDNVPFLIASSLVTNSTLINPCTTLILSITHLYSGSYGSSGTIVTYGSCQAKGPAFFFTSSGGATHAGIW